MKPSTPEQLLQALNWRYATKIFDPARKIPADIWDALVRTLVLTPTSFGMQPYRFLVIADPAKRAALQPFTWHQKQVTEASHYIVFTARTDMVSADVEKLLQRTASVRQVPLEKLEGFRKMLEEKVVRDKPGEIAFNWSARQAYIALGNLMTAAAMLGVDTCAIEGLEPESYDKTLGLEGSGYKTLAALALGYRADADKYAALAKVRYEVKDVVQII